MSKFNDLSALKGLKKELEQAENTASQQNGKASQPRREKKRELKSREEILGIQKAREEGLKPGMTVTLMDTCDRGKIVKVWKDHVDVDIDGLEFPVPFGGFIVNIAEEDYRLRRSIGGAKAQKEKPGQQKATVPSEMTVDLHIERIPGGYDAPEGFELPFQIDYFKRVLRENLKHRGMRIEFVHGVGDGILKDAMRKELDETFALSCSWLPGPAGVTIVTIK